MAEEGLSELIVKVSARLEAPFPGKTALVGLDGYVDKIQHPVQRQDSSGNVFYPTLESFGGKIREAAGKSAQIELFTQEVKTGGNAPIMANALGSLGIANTCLGTLGMPDIEPAFRAIHPDCVPLSVGKAAETNALEFDDGKLILSELSTFYELDWKKVVDTLGMELIIEKTRGIDLIAMVGLCNLPHAVDIWTGFLSDVVKPRIHSRPFFFFDLADPSRKSDEDMSQLMKLMQAYANYGHVTLGINENEAILMSEFMRRFSGITQKADGNINETGKFIFSQLGIDQLVVHPVDSCYVFTDSSMHQLQGNVVARPKVSTGGGDNFNAGFYRGILNGCSTEESMILAMAASGAYVQNGYSPARKDIKSYLKNWVERID